MSSIEPTPLSRDSLEEKRSLDPLSSSSPSSSSSESAEGLLHDARELEAQQLPDPAPEHQTSTRKKIIFVALYFFLNLTLTLTNKSVLNHVSTISTAATVLEHPH
jgi:hypothetical protein